VLIKQPLSLVMIKKKSCYYCEFTISYDDNNILERERASDQYANHSCFFYPKRKTETEKEKDAVNKLLSTLATEFN